MLIAALSASAGGKDKVSTIALWESCSSEMSAAISILGVK